MKYECNLISILYNDVFCFFMQCVTMIELHPENSKKRKWIVYILMSKKKLLFVNFMNWDGERSVKTVTVDMNYYGGMTGTFSILYTSRWFSPFFYRLGYLLSFLMDHIFDNRTRKTLFLKKGRAVCCFFWSETGTAEAVISHRPECGYMAERYSHQSSLKKRNTHSQHKTKPFNQLFRNSASFSGGTFIRSEII